MLRLIHSLFCGMLLFGALPAAARPADGSLELPRPDRAGELYVSEGFRLKKHSWDPKTKIALFFFSASWCLNCKQAGKALEEIYPSIRSDYPEVEFVTFGLDRSTRERAEYLRSTDFPWPAIGPAAADSVNWQLKVLGGIPQLQAFKVGPNRLVALTAPGPAAEVLKSTVDFLEQLR